MTVLFDGALSRRSATDRVGLMSGVLVLNGLPERERDALVVLHRAGFRPAEIVRHLDEARTEANAFSARFFPEFSRGAAARRCGQLAHRECREPDAALMAAE